MTGHRMLTRLVPTQLRLRFLIALVALTLVTLTYLHVSRRSLAAAEAAIALQREQWEARMTVPPRLWMGIRSETSDRFQHHPLTIAYRRDLQQNDQFYYDSVSWSLIIVDMWNDGERSFRVAGYRLWVRDEKRLAMERTLSGFVVPPNELRSFPVTQEPIALTVRQRQFEERYERPPCEESILGLRLQYSDWREDDRSSRDDFYPVLTPPLSAEFSIQRIERHG